MKWFPRRIFCCTVIFCRINYNWSAANGGLRDGGLRKSEDIWGKRPFSSVFWISQVLLAPSGKGRKRQKKGDFGRFRPISRKGGQTPLISPHLLHPHLRQPNINFTGFILARRLRTRREREQTRKQDRSKPWLFTKRHAERAGGEAETLGIARERVPFVPGTVPVCPGHHAAQNVYVSFIGFFLAWFLFVRVEKWIQTRWRFLPQNGS